MQGKKNLIRSCLVLAVALAAAPVFAAAAGSGVVNINTASAEQLELLPRVGPSIAVRILEFREANTRFESAEDLMLVRGIGERTFTLIEPYVTVSGESTLTEKVRAAKTGEASEGAGSEHR